MRAGGDGATCVALDLGAVTVRAVEMAFVGPAGAEGSVRILKRGSAPLPHGLWNDLGQQWETLASAIQQALSAAGITSRTVVACLPRRLVTVRLVKLPHASPDELRGMVAFEAQQVILYSLDEVILSYHVLPAPVGKISGDGDMESVLLAAARRSLIGDVMSAFDRAGLELQQLSVSSLALAEHGSGWTDPTAVINVEAGELDVAVVADRQPLFTRAASLDIQSASPEVATRRALEETVRSLTAFQNEYRTVPLSEILLAGAGSATSSAGSLELALKETLDMPVNPLVTRLLPMQDPELRAYVCAVGMGLQTRPESLSPINLVPVERAERRAQKLRSQRQATAMALAALVVVIGIAVFANKVGHDSKERQARLDANTKLTDLDDRLKKRQKQYDQVVKLAGDLTKGLDREHPAVDVLVALNASMPVSKDIWLDQLSLVRGGTLTLRGFSKTPLMATDLVIALQGSGAFTNVQLNYIGDAPESDANATAFAATSGTGNGVLPGMGSSTSKSTGGVKSAVRKPGPTVSAAKGAASRTAKLPGSQSTAAGEADDAAVPPISTPPGGIQKKSKETVATTDQPGSPGTLTNFVIVCRINPHAHDLTASVTPTKP